MINKRLIVLIICLVFLGGYVSIFELGGKEKSSGEEVEKIFSFDLKEVKGIKVTFQDKSILIQKENGKWKLKKPFDSPVKSKDISDIMSIFNYGIVRVVHDNPHKLSQWGLSQPEIELSLEVAEGSQSSFWKTLFIGKENPTSASSYAMVKGESRVLMIGIAYKMDLISFFERFFAYNQPKTGPA